MLLLGVLSGVSTHTTLAQDTTDYPIGTPAECPTDAAMLKDLGLDGQDIRAVFAGENIAWEGCLWVIQAVGIGSFELNLPAEYQATFTLEEADGLVVTGYGPLSALVRGSSIRFRPHYVTSDNHWVNDPCALAKGEDEFGMRRTPSYHTYNWNLPCDSVPSGTSFSGDESPVDLGDYIDGTASTSGSTIGSDDATKTPKAKATKTPKADGASQFTDCKSDENKWYADNIGGSADKWIMPDWAGGAWRFVDKGNFVTLTYPGFGKMTVWINGPVDVTADNASVLDGKTFDEASFACAG